MRAWSSQVGVLGGTGPAGRGLATRMAAAGLEVIVGSREPGRAEEAANAVREAVAGDAAVRGATNAEAATADLVVVATPWDGAVATAHDLQDALAGKVVISMVNAIARVGREFQALIPVRGSLAATLQAELPRSHVTAAFHHLPAGDLLDLSRSLSADVLVCAADEAAAATTIGLVNRIEGLRGLHAGSLASANAVEALTAVLLNVNRRYKAHASIRLSGLGHRNSPR